MDDNNVDSAYPKSPEEVASLEKATEDLLQRIPEKWTAVDIEELSAIEQRTMLLMIAAGFIERRLLFQMKSMLTPFSSKVEIAATGVCGFGEALNSVVFQMYEQCPDVFNEWAHCRSHAPVELDLIRDSWRLTDQGVLARGQLKKNSYERQFTFDFVLKRGAAAKHTPVRGAGRLLRLNREDTPPAPPIVAPPNVSIANWDVGAEAFVTQLGKAFGDAVSRGMVRNPEPSERPSISFDPTQITIGRDPYPLTEDAAHYLQVLLKHYGERMSDAEAVAESAFLKRAYEDRPRLKAVRDSLPPAVQAWIDISNSGTKLRRPV